MAFSRVVTHTYHEIQVESAYCYGMSRFNA